MMGDLGVLFEGFSPLVDALYPLRSGVGSASFFAYLERMIDELSVERKISLINRFPRLVSNHHLGKNSQQEHRAAGIEALAAEEKQIFQQLNDSYFEKFFFPFVICARDFDKKQILAQFNLRLARSREEEIAESIAQIKRIFWHRLSAVNLGKE
jgi:OHCU decarboxylase